MKNEKLDTAFMIASLVLAAAGLLFVTLSIFGGESLNWTLPAGLACVAAGSLINIIRMARIRKQDK